MATSGSISKSGSWATATLSWSRMSVDVANNRSTISYTLSLYRQYNISSSASKSYSVVINGSTVASGTTTIGGSGTKTIKTGTVVIPHNADGTKSFGLSFSLQMDVTLAGTRVGTLSNSATHTLDSIARASKPTLSASTVNYGSSVTIYTNRASSTFKHTLRYNWNGSSGTIATGVDTSYAWTVPLSLMSNIPSSTSSRGTIYCDTYNGSTLVGTNTITLTTNVPSNIVPSFSSVTATEAVSSVSSSVGLFVQGISKLNIKINGASGTYGSTIRSYSISFDGVTWSSSNVTTDFLKNSGTRTITATITDTRGRTATKTLNISVLAYSPPKITTLSVGRANSNGTNNEFGTYAKVTRSANTSSLKNGTTEKNVLKYTIKTKLRTETAWTTKVSLTTHSSLSLTGSNTIGTFDVTKSYDVRVEVSDLFNTTIALGVISTGEVTMSWGRDGIGVGKVWERGALDVGGDAFIEGDSSVSGVAKFNGGGKVGSDMNPVAWYGLGSTSNSWVIMQNASILFTFNNAREINSAFTWGKPFTTNQITSFAQMRGTHSLDLVARVYNPTRTGATIYVKHISNNYTGEGRQCHVLGIGY